MTNPVTPDPPDGTDVSDPGPRLPYVRATELFGKRAVLRRAASRQTRFRWQRHGVPWLLNLEAPAWEPQADHHGPGGNGGVAGHPPSGRPRAVGRDGAAAAGDAQGCIAGWRWGHRRRLLGLALASWGTMVAVVAAILWFAGCGSSGGGRFTGTAVPTAEWRGAGVYGEDAAALPRLLERAWPRVSARYPGWVPAGWHIHGWAGRIPCDGAINGTPTGCRGTTTPSRQTINLSWINGPADVVAIAEWELCNAAQHATTGVLRDVGCL